jgi:hypothetical protein
MNDHCVVTDELLPVKKTGEFTGPHKVVNTVRYILEDIGKVPPASPRAKAAAAVLATMAPVAFLDFSLEHLTINQFLFFLKKLCVKGYASATKFKCQMLLAHVVQFTKFYINATNMNSNINLSKKLNSNLCKIHALFHPDFVQTDDAGEQS